MMKNKGQLFMADMIIALSFMLLLFVAILQFKETSFFSFKNSSELDLLRAKTETASDLLMLTHSCSGAQFDAININCIQSPLNITKDMLGLKDFSCNITPSLGSFCNDILPQTSNYYSVSRKVKLNGSDATLKVIVWK